MYMYIYIYIYIYIYTDAYPPPTSVLIYDTEQSDSKVPVMLELWRMWSTLSLPSLSVPLWPGVIAPDRALSMV